MAGAIKKISKNMGRSGAQQWGEVRTGPAPRAVRLRTWSPWHFLRIFLRCHLSTVAHRCSISYCMHLRPEATGPWHFPREGRRCAAKEERFI